MLGDHRRESDSLPQDPQILTEQLAFESALEVHTGRGLRDKSLPDQGAAGIKAPKLKGTAHVLLTVNSRG